MWDGCAHFTDFSLIHSARWDFRVEEEKSILLYRFMWEKKAQDLWGKWKINPSLNEFPVFAGALQLAQIDDLLFKDSLRGMFPPASEGVFAQVMFGKCLFEPSSVFFISATFTLAGVKLQVCKYSHHPENGNALITQDLTLCILQLYFRLKLFFLLISFQYV